MSKAAQWDSGRSRHGKVIHAGPAEMLVARQETGGFDNRGGKPRQAHIRKIVPAFCGMSG